MKKLLALIVFFQVIANLVAQKQANNWILGQCRIDFNSFPTVYLDNAMFHERGSASISDKNGNLLFYTDGVTIWNKEHNQMPNGTNLIPSPQGSSTQESIFIPFPNNPSQYFLFTVDPWNGHETSGLYYAIIDTSLDSGKGDVITKETRILENTTSLISAVLHENQRDIWLLVHKHNTNEYYSFLISPDGISDSPVISELGNVHSGWGGQLKLSPDGQFLASTYYDHPTSEIVFARFDDSNGIIADEIVISGTSYSGIDFSSDATQLFATSGDYVYKFDISIFEKEIIENSLKQVGRPAIKNGLRQIQLSSDGNIYVTKGGGQVSGSEYLGIISPLKENEPEFIELGLYLDGARSPLYTPNFIQNYFFKTSFNYEGSCQGFPTQFNITNTHLLESAEWSFGEGSTSTKLNPEITYEEPGTYTISLKASYADHVDIITKEITIDPFPILELGENMELCFGSKLAVEDLYTTYQWNTGDTTATTRVYSSGYFVLEVTNKFGCVSNDSVYVDVILLPDIDLPDTLLLKSDSIEINPGQFNTYSWSTGESTQSIIVSQPGWYSVLVSNDFGCESSKSIYVGNDSEPNPNSDRWIRLNPKPTSLAGNDIAFVDDFNGFIVNSSQLLVTKNRGDSWEEFMSLDNGFKLAFKEGYGFIIGKMGSIYKSTYKGGGWNRLGTDLRENLNSITLLSKDSIFITGDNTLFKSFDGGKTWKAISIPNVNVEDSYFVTKNIGHVACKRGTILKTIDGGETWYETETSNTIPSDFFRIKFVDELVGYATQEHDDIYKTIDGGETWKEISSLDAGYALQFIDENIGFIAGDDGAMHKTEDGGETWNWIGFDGRKYGNDLYGIHFIDENIGFATGLRGRIIRTFDGGNSWENYSLTHNTISAIELESDETVYALVGNDILKSTSQGKEWTNLGSVEVGEKTRKINFINNKVGFAVGGGSAGTSASSNYIYKTIDGGITWIKQNAEWLGYGSTNLSAMFFVDENVGIASTDQNLLFKTVDSGISWTEVNSPGNRIREFQFIDSNVGYAINAGNYYGRLYKTTDGGENWELIYEDEGDEIHALHFINSEVGFLIGESGLKLRKTVDGGATWELIEIPYEWYEDVYFYSENYGFICDEEGRVFETLDGGQNWEQLGELSGVTKISTQQKEIWVYGSNGNILRSTITLGNQLRFSSMGISDITDSKASINSKLLSSLNDLIVTVEFNKLGSDVKEIEYGIIDAGTENLQFTLSNLDENSTYKSRFKAQLGDEIAFSEEIIFTTDKVLGVIKEENVLVYPNPTYSSLKIEGFDKFSEFALINLNGSLVKRGSESLDSIDLFDLPSGIYILILKGEKLQISKRIVKH